MCRLKKLDPGKDEVRIIVPTGACGSLTGTDLTVNTDENETVVFT